MSTNCKYREYFDIDEDYFPQINDSSIAAADPDFWMRTYPHPTFITMLKGMERVLARQEKRSIWVEGAYGTGKSQCAYALKRILEVPEDDLRTYWNKYEPLKKESDLLEKIIGHKNKGKGIVTAYRYASGMINSPRDLFLAVQDSLKISLEKAGLYAGENTLKESVIAWIDKPNNKKYFNDLLKEPEWSALFPQTSADDVLNALRKGGEVEELMGNIFRLANREGITAMNIDADKLIAWITDIIDRNNVKIVFIWDEFSDYFRKNRESLSEFQKLAELVNNKPFYFVVVTHESGQLFTSMDETGKKVRDRFISSQITLPDNIAFDLIGHAFNVKPAAMRDWETLAGDLNSRVEKSRSKVMEETGINDSQVMKKIMPIHPMAALLLKNIASAFKSNQRSMFDFIKSSNTDDVRAFQWFIENIGPFDDNPLLTVDMLWNFFYEKGKDNLTPDIRVILDTFSQCDNTSLSEDQKSVLKAILIMQAVDKRLGGAIDLFKATEQNLSYVFEGISDLEGSRSGSIAKSLKENHIVVSKPISGGRSIYIVAVLAGDQGRIDSTKKDLHQKITTQKLVGEGELSTVLSLSPALRLRFESEPGTGKIVPVTISDFAQKIKSLCDSRHNWKFSAVIAFAKDEKEAFAFRDKLREAIADEQYKNVIFIDALSTPLGEETLDEYVDFSAMAMYYQGNNNTSSRENGDKAKHVLDQNWKNRISGGQFIVYTHANPEGEKVVGIQGVASVLQSMVMKKFPYVFDFSKNLSESQLKTTAMKQSAKSGISQSTGGVVVGLEKHVLPSVWKTNEYWKDPAMAGIPISMIKTDVDSLIEEAFIRHGQVSISDIYGLLEEKYGFAPCNLSAFIAGFLLKEYGGDPFRYSDSSSGHEPMSQDKLAEMLGNCIGKSPKPTYIVKMTSDEMAFYELNEKTWGIPKNSCSSAGQAAREISEKMRCNLGLPVWCLEEVDSAGVFPIVQSYIKLVQKEGDEAHSEAVEIGRAVSERPSLAEDLSALLSVRKCQEGMNLYLRALDGGRILELAADIGAESCVLEDIRRLFATKYSCLWDRQIGEDEVRRLLTEYGVVSESNKILGSDSHSLTRAQYEWRERMKFVGVSCELIQKKHPALDKVFDTILRIYRQESILPDELKAFHSELENHGPEIKDLLDNDPREFAATYEIYLGDLADNEIVEVKSKLQTGMFDLSKTDSNIKVKGVAEEYRRNQLKSQLFRLWEEKTGTKNPREWSAKYKTPVLCCVSEAEFLRAKEAFNTLNRSAGTDHEIRSAIQFLESASIFDALSDGNARDVAFMKDIVGKYDVLLPEMNEVRDAIARVSEDPYEWHDDPNVKSKVRQLAEAEYNAGGSDRVIQKIDGMDDARLRQYLKRLVMDSMTVGIEILTKYGGR